MCVCVTDWSLYTAADCAEMSHRPPSYAVQRHHSSSGYQPFTSQPTSTNCPPTCLLTNADDDPWSTHCLPAVVPPPPPLHCSSTFCSPPPSTRGAKRRAASSSTLSSDVLPDIVSMIRQSPTEITALGNAAGRPTTSSSTQLGRLGSGSISHMSARNLSLIHI